MIITEITPARIGRSMKSFENPMIAARLAGRLDARAGGSDPAARADALHPVDDDAVVTPQAGAHDAQAALEIARLDDALLRQVVVTERPHEPPRLVAQDGAVGHEQRLELAGAEELQAAELPRCEETARIGDERAAADGAGRGVDPVVDEVHRADVRERWLVEEADADGIGRIARRPALAAG